jgi:hypothetical protein
MNSWRTKLGEAFWRFVIKYGHFDLFDENRQRRVVRHLLDSPDPRSRDAAVSRLDILPDWYETIYRWLGNPMQERYALRALASNLRLQGPYATTVIRGFLTDRIKEAMASSQPANDLWQLGQVILRWCRVVPEAASIHLDSDRPEFTLRQAANDVFNLARYLDALPARRQHAGAGELPKWSEIAPDVLTLAAEKSVARKVADVEKRTAA